VGSSSTASESYPAKDCFFQTIKLRCDERFTHAFTACGCVLKEITLVGSNQGYYFEHATACSKRTLKTTVATQLKIKFWSTNIKKKKKFNDKTIEFPRDISYQLTN